PRSPSTAATPPSSPSSGPPCSASRPARLLRGTRLTRTRCHPTRHDLRQGPRAHHGQKPRPPRPDRRPRRPAGHPLRPSGQPRGNPDRSRGEHLPPHRSGSPRRRRCSLWRASRPATAGTTTAMPAPQQLSPAVEDPPEGAPMSLSSYPIRASIAVSDMAQSWEFYQGKLGLRAGQQQADDSRLYGCGGGTSLHVSASAATAGTSAATLATWQVTNLERVVDELAANGVTFEIYGESLKTDEK